MKRNIRFPVLFCLITAQPACSDTLTYSAEPIEAWAIDAETKKPLEGVVVTANWQLTGGFEGGYPKGQAMVMETATDAKGRFYFPGWGPKMHLPDRKLREDQPQIVLFKPGFRHRILTNTFRGGRYSGKSEWSGRAIELRPFKENLVAYEEHFESLNRILGYIVADNPKECGWKEIPGTIRAMNRERRRLIALGVNPTTLSTIDNRLLRNDRFFTHKGGCGSPKKFFGGSLE